MEAKGGKGEGKRKKIRKGRERGRGRKGRRIWFRKATNQTDKPKKDSSS